MSLQTVDAKPIPTAATRTLPVLTPATDLYETDREITIVADMPGVDNAQLNVTLENDVLTISGRADATEPAGSEVLYREFGPAEFQCNFTLTGEIDREKISAKVGQGVLRVVLPKAQKAQARRIEVQKES